MASQGQAFIPNPRGFRDMTIETQTRLDSIWEDWDEHWSKPPFAKLFAVAPIHQIKVTKHKRKGKQRMSLNLHWSTSNGKQWGVATRSWFNDQVPTNITLQNCFNRTIIPTRLLDLQILSISQISKQQCWSLLQLQSSELYWKNNHWRETLSSLNMQLLHRLQSGRKL